MHGAMFVPVIAGSDKTTISIATGHQEYHPVYMSPGNLINTARCAHGSTFLPVAFLPIPKSIIQFLSHSIQLTLYYTSKQEALREGNLPKILSTIISCLPCSYFYPLKAGMTTPEVVKCPDGHYCRAIYGIGPYIADYQEQVWLAGIVQG